MKIIGATVSLASLLVLAGCSCLSAGRLDQGLTAPRLQPSRIIAKDEVPRAPKL